LNLKFNIQATNFEILTAIAYLYFYQNNVDFAVIEVGLGGRLDATNVMDNSLVSVITSISYDHQEFLGDTIAKIAYEKACIMKKNGIVVISPQQYEETYSVFIEQAKIMNCQLIWVKKSKRDKTNSNFAISEDDFRYTLPLLGDMQLENSATALRVIRILQSKGYYFSDDNIICGIQTTKWPGRCEWVFTNKFGKILVDGAHNPGGASALSQFVEQQRKQGQRVIWIFGSSKPPSTTLKVLKELLKERDFFVASSFQTPENMPWIKSLDLNIAVDLVTKNFSTIQATRCENLNQLNTVLSSFPQDCIKVLCGSLYLVSEFFRILKEEKK
jgi:dihydrofolate synthase/folylpolyglutamate synthase